MAKRNQRRKARSAPQKIEPPTLLGGEDEANAGKKRPTRSVKAVERSTTPAGDAAKSSRHPVDVSRLLRNPAAGDRTESTGVRAGNSRGDPGIDASTRNSKPRTASKRRKLSDQAIYICVGAGVAFLLFTIIMFVALDGESDSDHSPAGLLASCERPEDVFLYAGYLAGEN